MYMEKTLATVWANDGGKVKMRESPSLSCDMYWNLPTGTQVEVVSAGDEWTKIKSGNHAGYMLTKYLIVGDVMLNVADNGVIHVDRKRLEDVYDELGDILGMRG